MKKLNKKTPIVFYLGMMLLCLVMLSFNLTSGLYARYTTKSSASDSSRVASFVFDVSATGSAEFLDISEITKPGDNKEYTFVVSNGTVDNCCEVKQQYTVDITINGSMPLTYTLAKNGEAGVSASATDVLIAGEVDFDTYTLIIEWPPNQNDVKYANGAAVGEVILTVRSEQVD